MYADLHSVVVLPHRVTMCLRPVLPCSMLTPRVQEPMCLVTMERKLDNFEYRRVQQFVDDFMLIVNNCRDFNGKDSGQSLALGGS